LLIGDPSTSLHGIVVHKGDVRSGTAKGKQSELQEEESDLPA